MSIVAAAVLLRVPARLCVQVFHECGAAVQCSALDCFGGRGTCEQDQVEARNGRVVGLIFRDAGGKKNVGNGTTWTT